MGRVIQIYSYARTAVSIHSKNRLEKIVLCLLQILY